MPSTSTIPAPDTDSFDEHQQARLELLETLPARLEPDALSAVMHLHDVGKAPQTIARTLRLDQLVVVLEICRELQRIHNAATVEEGQQSGPPAALTRREWNRLAKGTHIPNQPLRLLIDRAIDKRPDLTQRAILHLAGIRDATHAARLLGRRPYPGASRPSQTISCEQAARLTRAVGHDPREVPGL